MSKQIELRRQYYEAELAKLKSIQDEFVIARSVLSEKLEQGQISTELQKLLLAAVDAFEEELSGTFVADDQPASDLINGTRTEKKCAEAFLKQTAINCAIEAAKILPQTISFVLDASKSYEAKMSAIDDFRKVATNNANSEIKKSALILGLTFAAAIITVTALMLFASPLIAFAVGMTIILATIPIAANVKQNKLGTIYPYRGNNVCELLGRAALHEQGLFKRATPSATNDIGMERVLPSNAGLRRGM